MVMLPWGAAPEQEAEPVVLEVPEPEAEALDVLDDEVGGSTRPSVVGGL
jgi:hypothetical protein